MIFLVLISTIKILILINLNKLTTKMKKLLFNKPHIFYYPNQILKVKVIIEYNSTGKRKRNNKEKIRL